MFNFIKNHKKPEETKEQNDNEILYPPYAFDGYEISNEEKTNLSNLCNLLTNNLIDIQQIDLENKYTFVDSLVQLGYITADLQQGYSLFEMVNEINKIAKNLSYHITLSSEDILKQDDEKVKQARNDFGNLTNHDLNICAELLAQQGYELFQVFLDCGGLNMSILPKNKIEELKKYVD